MSWFHWDINLSTLSWFCYAGPRSLRFQPSSLALHKLASPLPWCSPSRDEPCQTAWKPWVPTPLCECLLSHTPWHPDATFKRLPRLKILQQMSISSRATVQQKHKHHLCNPRQFTHSAVLSLSTWKPWIIILFFSYWFTCLSYSFSLTVRCKYQQTPIQKYKVLLVLKCSVYACPWKELCPKLSHPY